MAELAREGGAYKGAALAPTEITDCFCILEGGTSESVGDKTSSRRKNSGRAGLQTPMILHLSPKQLLVARKPTLMDDLITRNKTALMRNKMERIRAAKNKRSDVDSDPQPLAIKRLRSNEPIKNNKSRKTSEDRNVRMNTRRFVSSLRSGKKRSHLKEASLLDKKKRSLKASGTRSNDSETDTPNPSSKPNGHPVDIVLSKQVEKVDKNVASISKQVDQNEKSSLVLKLADKMETNVPVLKLPEKNSVSKQDKADKVAVQASKQAEKVSVQESKQVEKPEKNSNLPAVKSKSHPECKPSSSHFKSNEPKVKRVRKKRRKADSMIWLKKAKQKHHTESKPFIVTKIKSDPFSEPEDSGLGSEMKLDLGKTEDRLNQVDSNVPKEEIKVNESSVSSDGKHTWTIETFQVAVCKETTLPEINGSLDKSPHLEENLSQDAHDPEPSDFKNEIAVSPEIPTPVLEHPAETEIKESTLSLDQSLSKETLEEQQLKVVPPVDSDSNDSDFSLALTEDLPCTQKVAKDPEPDTLNTIESSPVPLVSEDFAISASDLRLQVEKLIEAVSIDNETISDDLNKPNTTEVIISETSISETVIIEKDFNLETPLVALDMEKCDKKEQAEIKPCEVDTKPEESDIPSCEMSVLDESQTKTLLIEDDKLDNESDHLDNSELNDPLIAVCKSFISNEVPLNNVITQNGKINDIQGSKDLEDIEKKGEGEECQAEKADWLKALGLQSLRPVAGPPPTELPLKEFKDEKPSKLTEPGYTGTLKAVIKLNKGAPRSIVFKSNEETKPEYQISSEAAASGVPITHLADISNVKKVKEVVATDFDTVSNSSYVSGAPQSDSAESDEDKGHGKESNLIIPEKSSSFSIHPGRLCCDVCCYCFGKFGSLDTPCHIAQLKGEERQQKILQNEPYLTLDSCLCDACYRYVDRKANFPSSAAAKTAKRARPPAATLCCVTDCTHAATHSVKRKWLLKIKRSLANKFEIDMEKHTTVFNPLCSNHHYWVDYYMVCGICRKRLNRNHLYTLGPETDRLNLVLAEDGIPARLSDKLFLCKLCRYYANMRLKYSDPSTIPPSSQPFYTNYRKKILASLDVPVSDSDEDKPKPKEGKDDDVMSLSGLATLLSDQPDPNQPRIQVKFGNVNIGTLSNLNIGQGRQEERTSYDRGETANLPLNATFDFQGPSTSDGSWEKVTSTLQFDKKTKQLWQDLQRPYGNQSSFLRHLVMLEKYWRSGYLVLSSSADSRAAKYINSVQTRNKSFEGKSEIKDIKVEIPPLAEPSPTPPPVQDTILKVPDPSKRFSEDSQSSAKSTETQKSSVPPVFCPIIPTGEVEVLPVNPNAKSFPKEKPASKGTVIIQRPATSQPQTSQSPCKIMITSVQSLAKPKVDPVLLNRAKSLVRMVSPGVSRQRPPASVPIQRFPSRMARPRQQPPYIQQSPYQTLQAQLQAPPSNHPLQSLQQVVLNRYPPPLVKINQQGVGQQRVPTPKPQSSPIMVQQQTSQSSVNMLQQQPSVSLIQQHPQSSAVSLFQQPSVSLFQQQPMVTLVQQHSQISLLQQQQPSLSVQIQSQQPSVSLLQSQANIALMQSQTLKSGPPPPYSLRPLLPKLPPSLSISTSPQSTAPSLPPSVSLLPPSSNGIVVPSSSTSSVVSSNSMPLPPVSTLTSKAGQLLPPPPYCSTVSSSPRTSSPLTTPSVSLIPTTGFGNFGHSVTMIPTSLPSSITLPSSGITIEKQPHNFSSPPILPPEKPIISVFREPLPADT